MALQENTNWKGGYGTIGRSKKKIWEDALYIHVEVCYTHTHTHTHTPPDFSETAN